MGNPFSKKKKVGADGTLVDPDAPDSELKDQRRRNSLAFYMTTYVKKLELKTAEEEKDDFDPLTQMHKDAVVKVYEQYKKEKDDQNPMKGKKLRETKFTKIARNVLAGSFKQLKTEVITSWKTINRKYKDQFLGYSLIHFVCQEGYLPMLEFMLNPESHSVFDTEVLDLSPLTDRKRTPLMLLFTPTICTASALNNGIDEHDTAISVRPEGIETMAEWIKPGGQAEREAMVKLLLQHGVSPEEKDYHEYAPIHYSVVLNWVDTVKTLHEKGADINAATSSGKTALMLAIEFDRVEILEYLLKQVDLQINAADTDGFTALILAVQKSGNAGMLSTEMLLKCKADPNLQTARRKTALKFACMAQDLPMVNLLMNNNVNRRPSAFNLLKDEAHDKIMARIEAEERRARELAEKAEKEKMRKALMGIVDETGKDGYKRNPWGQWVDYNDKKKNQIFYYNKVTRVSQWEKPIDFKKDPSRLVKDVNFGLHFYH